MNLCDTLQIRRRDVVALVGGGGKTTAMYRLAQELAQRDWRIISTTTTMIRPPTTAQTDCLIVSDNLAELVARAQSALGRCKHVTLASGLQESDDKLKGIDPDSAGKLAQLADVLLIEADGSRGLPIKAPAPYEPVIPAETTLVIPLVGIEALGQPLSPQTAHRPELLSSLTGLAIGERIDIETYTKLLTQPEGSLKEIPAHARVVPMVNKVHDEQALAQARLIARGVQAHERVAGVLITALTEPDPVIEWWRPTAAIVLAAGGSSRFGSPKQLLRLSGETMLRHIVEVVGTTSACSTLVVLGNQAESISKSLPPGCRTVVNDQWESGISSSIRVGLDAILAGESSSAPGRQTEAVLFVLGDQPCLSRDDVERIINSGYRSLNKMVAPVHRGSRGNPVLFPRCFFSALRELSGDSGGRQLFDRFANDVLEVQMSSADVLFDVDTPDDYREYLSRATEQGPALDQG